MMKTTLGLFFAAVGLLTVAIAVPERVEPPKQVALLDGEGITALRVEGDVDVNIGYGEACNCREDDGDRPKEPHVRWRSDGTGRVDIRRDGDTLVLVASAMDEGAGIEVRPPAGVRFFDIPGGRVSADDPLPAMRVHTRDDLTWSADAASLAVIQTPTAECLASEYCGVAVYVSGRIGDVEVEAGDATVDLQTPDRFGRAVVTLAPESVVTVNHARRVDHIRVEYVDFEGSPLTAAQAEAVRAAAQAAKDAEAEAENESAAAAARVTE